MRAHVQLDAARSIANSEGATSDCDIGRSLVSIVSHNQLQIKYDSRLSLYKVRTKTIHREPTQVLQSLIKFYICFYICKALQCLIFRCFWPKKVL